MRWSSRALKVSGASSKVCEVEGLDDIARAGEAQAEIGVLGDVIGVPESDFAQRLDAKMIGGAAEKNRQPHRAEALVEHVEQRRVIQREMRGEPIMRAIVDAKAGLQTGDARGQPREQRRRAPQLARLRHILRVEHRQQRAARERRRYIHRARLGSWRAVGRDQYLVRRARPVPRQRPRRGAVVLFDDEDHVELRAGIIEPVDRPRQLKRHAGLAIQRHDQRIDRQSRVGERGGSRLGLETLGAGEEPQENRG